VLSGECILVVEGQERLLRSGDFFQCPPLTGHVFVGAGGRRCTILMIGGRTNEWGEGEGFPVDAIAARYGASAAETTRLVRRSVRRHPGGRAGTPAVAAEFRRGEQPALDPHAQGFGLDDPDRVPRPPKRRNQASALFLSVSRQRPRLGIGGPARTGRRAHQ
jgi:hypothetical protein